MLFYVLSNTKCNKNSHLHVFLKTVSVKNTNAWQPSMVQSGRWTQNLVTSQATCLQMACNFMDIFFCTFLDFRRTCKKLLSPAMFSAEVQLVRKGWGMPTNNIIGFCLHKIWCGISAFPVPAATVNHVLTPSLTNTAFCYVIN